MKYIALAVSFDDPNGELPRTNAIILLDGEAIALPQYADCGENQEAFNDCRDAAAINFRRCITQADNDFDTCLINNGVIGGLIGGFIGCVVGKLKFSPAGGPLAVKAILIGCAFGALVGAALAIWQCYNSWKNAKHDCEIDLDADLDICWLLCD